jgi:hypothetical protein
VFGSAARRPCATARHDEDRDERQARDETSARRAAGRDVRARDGVA